MNGHLTDEQIAWLRASTYYSGGATTATHYVDALAAEVAAYRAMRPKCPTCEGLGSIRRWSYDHDPSDNEPCPANCEDGFTPLADWVKLLIETHDDDPIGMLCSAIRTFDHWSAPMELAVLTWKNRRDAVLKMTGDQ